METLNLKFLFLTQGAIVLACILVFALVQPQNILPFLAGATLITVNFALLALLWRRVLDKKPVATTIAVIVFKYAILIMLLYVFISQWKLQLVPLFTGVATIIGSFLITAIRSAKS